MNDVGNDTTLAANRFTAYVPNPAIPSKLTHLFSATVGAAGRYAWRGLKWLLGARSHFALTEVRPPGELLSSTKVAPLGEGMASDAIQRAKPITITSHETLLNRPILPATYVGDVRRYCQCITTASRPHRRNQIMATKYAELCAANPGMGDAFQKDATVMENDGTMSHVLPSSVLKSTLVNQKAQDYEDKITTPVPGEISEDFVTHLADAKTGFSSSIMYDKIRREVVISFSGAGSANMERRQYTRCGFNISGLLIPKNMSQASKLTKVVKAHIDALNTKLPPGEKIKLTLTGHSMGGGLASYAALRNKVSAVVINPMRQGWAARASVGQATLEEAHRYLTEVVVQEDWLSDNRFAQAYYLLTLPLGFDSLGPVGTANRFMLPFATKDSTNDAHNDVIACLDKHEAHHTVGTTYFGEFAKTLKSNQSRADVAQGKIKDAVLRELYRLPFPNSNAARADGKRVTMEDIAPRERNIAALAQQRYDALMAKDRARAEKISKGLRTALRDFSRLTGRNPTIEMLFHDANKPIGEIGPLHGSEDMENVLKTYFPKVNKRITDATTRTKVEQGKYDGLYKELQNELRGFLKKKSGNSVDRTAKDISKDFNYIQRSLAVFTKTWKESDIKLDKLKPKEKNIVSSLFRRRFELLNKIYELIDDQPITDCPLLNALRADLSNINDHTLDSNRGFEEREGERGASEQENGGK